MERTKSFFIIVITRIPAFLFVHFIFLLGWEKLNSVVTFNTFPIGLGLILLSTYIAVNFIGGPIVDIFFPEKSK